MGKKLKVLEGMDAYLPNVDGVIVCMHNYCLNSMDKVDLVAVAPKHKENIDLPYRVERCSSIRIPGRNIQYPFPKADKKFRDKIMGEDFDIVHVHTCYNMGEFCLKVAREKGIPIVGTFHTNFHPIYAHIFHSKKIADFLCRKIGDFFNKLDEVFVCSPSVEAQARSYGVTTKISYLPYGTELEKVDDLESLKQKANELFDMTDDELVFIFIGRVMKLKRIDMVLDSLKILKDRGTKFRFFVVGTGSGEKAMKAKAERLGFSESEVIFTGFVERAVFPVLTARADLLLFPSLYDNFALVKVEAAGYKTPGVFIKGSCTADGVEDGVSGFLSDDSVTAFADTIERVVSDRENLKRVGENASKMLYITWADCTQKVLTRYQEIVEEKRCGK